MTADFTPDFIPPEDEPLSPEEEGDALEALDLRGDPDVIVSDDPPPPVGRSYAFNLAQKRFEVATSGRAPLETRGDSTLAYWIEKALVTARGAHPIYDDDYGMEDPFAEIGEQTIGQVDEADLEGRIADALAYHPRIAGIEDFEVDQTNLDDETLLVSFTVIKDDESTFSLTGLEVTP